jgi:hypothetical protein
MAFDLDEDELRATRKMNKADRNEIEVNDYVRTKNGVIDKVDALYGMIENTVHLENQKWFDIKNIVKHSKQLIDLIEVKDVIKYKINNISTTLETKGYVEGIVDISDEEMLQKIKSDKNYHILEILTKERYMTNCYKVGGEDGI